MIFRKETNQSKRYKSKSDHCFSFVDINPISFFKNLTLFVWRHNLRWWPKALKEHETGDQKSQKWHLTNCTYFAKVFASWSKFGFWNIEDLISIWRFLIFFPTEKFQQIFKTSKLLKFQLSRSDSSSIWRFFFLLNFYERQKNSSNFVDIPASVQISLRFDEFFEQKKIQKFTNQCQTSGLFLFLIFVKKMRRYVLFVLCEIDSNKLLILILHDLTSGSLDHDTRQIVKGLDWWTPKVINQPNDANSKTNSFGKFDGFIFGPGVSSWVLTRTKLRQIFLLTKKFDTQEFYQVLIILIRLLFLLRFSSAGNFNVKFSVNLFSTLQSVSCCTTSLRLRCSRRPFHPDSGSTVPVRSS